MIDQLKALGLDLRFLLFTVYEVMLGLVGASAAFVISNGYESFGALPLAILFGIGFAVANFIIAILPTVLVWGAVYSLAGQFCNNSQLKAAIAAPFAAAVATLVLATWTAATFSESDIVTSLWNVMIVPGPWPIIAAPLIAWRVYAPADLDTKEQLA